MSAAELNRLLQRSIAYEDAWEGLKSLDPRLLANYQLDEKELNVLRAPDGPGCAGAGVHPMLAMWLFIARDPTMATGMSAKEYFADSSASKEA